MNLSVTHAGIRADLRAAGALSLSISTSDIFFSFIFRSSSLVCSSSLGPALSKARQRLSVDPFPRSGAKMAGPRGQAGMFIFWDGKAQLLKQVAALRPGGGSSAGRKIKPASPFMSPGACPSVTAFLALQRVKWFWDCWRFFFFLIFSNFPSSSWCEPVCPGVFFFPPFFLFSPALSST